MPKHFTKDAFQRLETKMNKKKPPDDNSENESLPEINQEIFCTICQEEVLTGSVWLPCGHCFHIKCIVEWKKKKPKCPNCRSVQHYHCMIKLRFPIAGAISDCFLMSALFEGKDPF